MAKKKKVVELHELYYDPVNRMFFITSEDSDKSTTTGLTVSLGTNCTDSTWTWDQDHARMDGRQHVCNVIDLFKEIEKKLDK